MTAGRPRTSGQAALPELDDLADWFKQALATAGHPSVNAFLTALRDPRHRTSASGPLPSRKTVYEVAGALALPDLEAVQYLAQALGSAPAAVTPRWLRARRALDRKELAEQVRPQPHGTYRLVITSRPLPQEELAPFAGLPGLGYYTLRGFDADQRHVFAERWFAAQGDANPAGQADAFASDIEDASLEGVLQVPLLATIAAAFRSRNPGRAFPRGLVELYESFLADLDNAREGNAAVLGGFLDRWTERGYGEMAAWLVRNQDRLLTHLAWQRTAVRPPASLLDAALVWLARHLPAGLEWPRGAEGELGQFLARSGVVASTGGRCPSSTSPSQSSSRPETRPPRSPPTSPTSRDGRPASATPPTATAPCSPWPCGPAAPRTTWPWSYAGSSRAARPTGSWPCAWWHRACRSGRPWRAP